MVLKILFVLFLREPDSISVFPQEQVVAKGGTGLGFGRKSNFILEINRSSHGIFGLCWFNQNYDTNERRHKLQLPHEMWIS